MKNYQLHNLHNGNGKNRLIFPQIMDIKVIVDNQHPEQQSRAHLKTLLSQLEIPNTNWRSRKSTGGNYISYTVKITLNSETTMKKMYADLKTLPGIRMAL